jgi:hypothetical protein
MKKIVKIKESELVNLIDRIITESTSKSKDTDYDKEVDNYKYFIIDTKNKKVISGWEFKEDAKDSLDDIDNKENHKIVHLSKLSNYDIKDPKKTFKNNVNETKKIVKIKESELVNLIDRIITESTKGVKTKNKVNESVLGIIAAGGLALGGHALYTQAQRMWSKYITGSKYKPTGNSEKVINIETDKSETISEYKDKDGNIYWGYDHFYTDSPESNEDLYRGIFKASDKNRLVKFLQGIKVKTSLPNYDYLDKPKPVDMIFLKDFDEERTN